MNMFVCFEDCAAMAHSDINLERQKNMLVTLQEVSNMKVCMSDQIIVFCVSIIQDAQHRDSDDALGEIRH